MLNPKMTKILIACSGFLFMALGGLIIYNVFFLSSPETDTQASEQEQSSEQGEQKSKSLPITEVGALGPTLLTGNRLKFYEEQSGNVVAVNGDGSSRKVLDDITIEDLSAVRWGPNSTWVATRAGDVFSTFNYQTGESHTFDANVNNLHFTGNKVVYTYQTSDGADLSIANPDGGQFEQLVSLSTSEVSVNPIPQTFKISYVLKPSAYRASSLTVISSTTKESETLLTDQFGLQMSWGPEGKKGLAASTVQRGGSEMTFSVIDQEGNVSQTFGTGTVADKIVWQDANTVYFTKPKLSEDVVMPDDYVSGKLGDFREALFKLDLAKGEVTEIHSDIGQVNSTNLVLNEAGTRLYFRNKRDGKLYGVSISK